MKNAYWQKKRRENAKETPRIPQGNAKEMPRKRQGNAKETSMKCHGNVKETPSKLQRNAKGATSNITETPLEYHCVEALRHGNYFQTIKGIVARFSCYCIYLFPN
jgi:hypothetical protein